MGLPSAVLGHHITVRAVGALHRSQHIRVGRDRKGGEPTPAAPPPPLPHRGRTATAVTITIATIAVTTTTTTCRHRLGQLLLVPLFQDLWAEEKVLKQGPPVKVKVKGKGKKKQRRD